jgi:hypothetical protein
MAHRHVGDGMLKELPYLEQIMRDDHRFIAIQKSAQVGVTEMMVNMALWAADTGYAGRGNVLYMMPTQNQMDDFARSRFDRAIQDSSYLRSRLQPDPPRRKGADSVRLKKIGPGYIYLRGSESKRQIASVDADLVILDEFDQMAEGTLELAMKRLSSSSAGKILVASTPRYPEAGINGLYLTSDQNRYLITCDACGLEQNLTWSQNVDTEAGILRCTGCEAQINGSEKKRWSSQAPGNSKTRGYQISRLYSPWLDLAPMIEASNATTPAGLQEFQNSDLGEVFSPPGGGVTLDILDKARGTYTTDEYKGQPCVMGVDVGLVLHVVVRESLIDWESTHDSIGHVIADRPPRLWYVGQVDSFEELDEIYERFNVNSCVIDAYPETRKAQEFADRHESVRLAYYRSADGHTHDETSVHLNRVEALDEALARYRELPGILPSDARSLGGAVRDGVGQYYHQVMAPQRTLKRDQHGNWVARWVEGSRADHFAHAEVYAWAAHWSGTQNMFGLTSGHSIYDDDW